MVMATEKGTLTGNTDVLNRPRAGLTDPPARGVVDLAESVSDRVTSSRFSTESQVARLASGE